ncbi:hypothetical protein JQ634_30655 [Bradyrhizobium sp. AUGA SZCCT0240]|nr:MULTISPECIES: tripartite tricarboxylate transporter substrate-binding protein [unclassified Bradyrhizobium]MBR1193836.1 hypothetical protein [Bradyrhizobium sp. AUGA SZCCT0160]MBR1199980.1 hypothetical protein [Bradyrhizobium sp. AUGA SZCCT0158]MBR1244346.1 hypothetical protein [Bradyrhizobium sp. AUGA SZCCT0274]MBR1258029.1 hypothetical protein [Bradyrhizobium sp. AUGA SZCCT0240]
MTQRQSKIIVPGAIIVFAFATLVGTLPAVAQDFPTRIVTMVVPAPAGGTTDIAARLLSEGLSRRLSQPFVIENKGGASGNVATAQVARSAPDGYSLLVTYSGYHVTNPALFPRLNWDPIKDFSPVANVVTAPYVIVVRKDLPVKTLENLSPTPGQTPVN